MHESYIPNLNCGVIYNISFSGDSEYSKDSEESQRSLRGLSEESQRTLKRLSENSQRNLRGLLYDLSLNLDT